MPPIGVIQLCNLLGHPQNNLKIIYITGTNGKGSTSTMLASILQSAGYKVGLYTSPQLIKKNERIRINGVKIDEDFHKNLIKQNKQLCLENQIKISSYGLDVVSAFQYFKDNACDLVVLEALVGGARDHANVMHKTLLSIITNVTKDHVAKLGFTPEQIAQEKAGIIKLHCPVLFGGTDPNCIKVIKEKADKYKAPYCQIDYNKLHINNLTLDGANFDYDNYKNINISLLGSYQPKNTAIVLSAIDILKSNGLQIPETAIYEGLQSAKWPARFEILSKDPLIIFDGGHNPDGVDAAIDSIKQYFGNEKVYILTGVLRDKDYRTMAQKLSEITEKAFTITPNNPRALRSQIWSNILNNNNIKSFSFESIKQGIEMAIKKAKNDNKPLLCIGTFYTYAPINDYLDNGDKGVL